MDEAAARAQRTFDAVLMTFAAIAALRLVGAF